jgi:ABC-type sugar transport system ATPase subunit
MHSPLLELKAIEKRFSGAIALKALSLTVTAGESLGVIGENGAGKSTLLKILSGVHQPDGGEIHWAGERATFNSPLEARQAGIATIHQELAYCGSVSVAENMLLGEPWPKTIWGGVNWSELHRIAGERLAAFGVNVSTNIPFSELSPAQKQEVAIARALAQKARLLILDEPTASLTEPEVERLFASLQKLREKGLALIYVSHRLDEILRITDRVAVLRDGELVSISVTAEVTIPRMIKDMVGRPLDQVYPRERPKTRGTLLLKLREVSRHDLFEEISLDLHAGEIVGLAGLVGAGRSELARAIYGLYPIDSGSMQLGEAAWRPLHPRESIKAGLAYLPEERKRQGLVLEHSLGESISIGFSDLLCHWGLIRRHAEENRVLDAIKRYDVRARSADQAIGTLSGGNQQKAMLARWLERGPAVLILDEPTRGVDVGAKAEIHSLIDRLAATGKAILLISSDLLEVLGMSDRVLVMAEGRISAELTGNELTQENVLLAASGLPHGN